MSLLEKDIMRNIKKDSNGPEYPLSYSKMFLPVCSIWCVLLTRSMSAGGLEISGYDSDEVICSQGLYDCNMKNEIALTVVDSEAVDVKSLIPHIKLCCKDRGLCAICLLIDTEINISVDEDTWDEDYSEYDEEDYSEEDYSEETWNPKASVTVCFSTALTMPMCKKVEFMVNHSALTHQNQAKFSMVITEPTGISFGSRVIVYSFTPSHLRREVVVPSLNEVCSQEQQKQVKECHVPRLSSVVHRERNQVELRSADGSKTLPTVCIQYEYTGRCQRWNRTTIPLYSVTPCMCFQVWDEDDQTSRRSLSCPFINTDFAQINLWQNVSVSVGQGQTNSDRSVLWWNLSSPCRLEGEVWPCHKENGCGEVKGFTQQLANGTWRQNSKGQWEKIGVFEDIYRQFSPCVMVEVKGMGPKLGPFCVNNGGERLRWSILIVCVLLLVSLTVLIFYLLHNFVKKWVCSWHHGGFVEIGRRRHVVLLSPPDINNSVSESVCQLGTLLCNRGFSVSVDQWSRKEQCSQGPLPWLHSQLLELKDYGGRVVLILTSRALDRAEEWTRRHKGAIQTNGEEGGLPQIGSPYSDVFMASLCLIQADKQLGRAGKRFLLVDLDSDSRNDEMLPEPLQGLLLFHFPSQTEAFLAELAL